MKVFYAECWNGGYGSQTIIVVAQNSAQAAEVANKHIKKNNRWGDYEERLSASDMQEVSTDSARFIDMVGYCE